MSLTHPNPAILRYPHPHTAEISPSSGTVLDEWGEPVQNGFKEVVEPPKKSVESVGGGTLGVASIGGLPLVKARPVTGLGKGPVVQGMISVISHN